MKLRMYAVKDHATGLFGTPMFLITAGQAIRSFTDEVNRADKENPLYLHPRDYDLYFLGEWDSENGEFVCGEIELIARAANLAVKEIN